MEGTEEEGGATEAGRKEREWPGGYEIVRKRREGMEGWEDKGREGRKNKGI